MTIEAVISESMSAKDGFWFIEYLDIVEQTDFTITLHFIISQEMFVQIYFSERSSRVNFALIGKSGRLYGCDCEYGFWHRHSFEDPKGHEATPIGMSPRPIIQFLSEVEQILVNNDLI